MRRGRVKLKSSCPQAEFQFDEAPRPAAKAVLSQVRRVNSVETAGNEGGMGLANDDVFFMIFSFVSITKR